MDVLGLVIAVVVLAANSHDNAAGNLLLDQVAERAGGTVRKALVDQGFKNQVVAHGAGLGTDVEIVQRNPQVKGFVPQPKRWRVEWNGRRLGQATTSRSPPTSAWRARRATA